MKHPLGYHIFLSEAEKYQLPTDLLYAICLQESGFTRKSGTYAPWPWTLNIGGQGRRYDTHGDALKALLEHISSHADIRTKYMVDVGMCQINLYWHRQYLRLDENGLRELLLPQQNAAYAARYLNNLWRETNSLSVATGLYHSRNPTRAAHYRYRVSEQIKEISHNHD